MPSRFLIFSMALLSSVVIAPWPRVVGATAPSRANVAGAARTVGETLTVMAGGAGFRRHGLVAGQSQAPAAGPGWSWYADAYHHVRLQYPASWTVIAPTTESYPSFLAPGEKVEVSFHGWPALATRHPLLPPGIVSAAATTMGGVPATLYQRYMGAPSAGRVAGQYAVATVLDAVVANTHEHVELWLVVYGPRRAYDSALGRAGRAAFARMRATAELAGFTPRVAPIAAPGPHMRSWSSATDALTYSNNHIFVFEVGEPGGDDPECTNGTDGSCPTYTDATEPHDENSIIAGGRWQSDYACTEAVSRDLAAAGVIPLNPSADNSQYLYFTSGGAHYDLLWVADLYHYLLNTGMGVDIGNNPQNASTGDVVIFGSNMAHVGILTQGGVSDPTMNSHNQAWQNVPVDNWSDPVDTIVHIHWPSGPASNPGSVLQVDNSDAGFAPYGPSNYWLTCNAGINGSMIWTTNAQNASQHTNGATWSAAIDQTGYWDAQAYIPDQCSNATQATYTVNSQAGSITAIVDQQSYTNQWADLGAYPYVAGQTASVSLTDLDPADPWRSTSVGFDAVRWVLVNEQVDNSDAGFAPYGPSNYWLTCNAGINGSMIWTTNAQNASQHTNGGTWQTNIPSSGRWAVQAYIPDQCSNATQATYTIASLGGVATTAINQQSYTNQWADLGTYTFSAGQSATVSLTDLDPADAWRSTSVGFDAVRWVYEGPSQPTSTPTASPTSTMTPTWTATVPLTSSPTWTASPTDTPTATPTASPSATATASPTWTPTSAPSSTPTATVSPTATPSGTATALPTGSLVLPWYDDASMHSTVRVANSAATAATVSLTVHGQLIGMTLVRAHGSASIEGPGIVGGPAVISANGANVTASVLSLSRNGVQQTAFTPLAAFASGAYFSGVPSGAGPSWLVVTNPSAQAFTISGRIGGQTISIQAPGASSTVTPLTTGGPITLSAPTGSVFLATLRTVRDGAFHEMLGLPPSAALTQAAFAHYDAVGSHGHDWLVLSNPGASPAHVILTFAGQPAGSLLLPAGALTTTVLAGKSGGPLLVSSDQPLYMSQRIGWGSGGVSEQWALPASAVGQGMSQVYPIDEGALSGGRAWLAVANTTAVTQTISVRLGSRVVWRRALAGGASAMVPLGRTGGGPLTVSGQGLVSMSWALWRNGHALDAYVAEWNAR